MRDKTRKRVSLLGALLTGIAGMGIIGVLIAVSIALFVISMMFYGLWLAFSASILLGIIVLLVEPSPLIIGLVMFFFDKNLAQMIMDFLNK